MPSDNFSLARRRLSNDCIWGVLDLNRLKLILNLEIVERHNHSMPSNYVPFGQDATVLFDIKTERKNICRLDKTARMGCLCFL
ncbi:MAG TPA: hypothetical protein DG577_09775 [Firmicutes bacterium]|nr:hypothetical protein [Bacillota bacterium]